MNRLDRPPGRPGFATPVAAVPQPVSVIQISLLPDGRVAVAGNLPSDELVLHRVLDAAKAVMIDGLRKQAAKTSAIQVAPPGMTVERNGD